MTTSNIEGGGNNWHPWYYDWCGIVDAKISGSPPWRARQHTTRMKASCCLGARLGHYWWFFHARSWYQCSSSGPRAGHTCHSMTHTASNGHNWWICGWQQAVGLHAFHALPASVEDIEDLRKNGKMVGKEAKQRETGCEYPIPGVDWLKR